MAHTIYSNFVLENKVEDFLLTNVDLNGYITIDQSLTEQPGMKKVINKYTATGNVEDLAMGVGNSEDIEVSFTSTEYVVGVTQGRMQYFDELEMTDPMVVEVGLKKLADQMTNDLTTKAIVQWDGASLIKYECTWIYDDIVDAIAMYPYESEDGLFLFISPAEKAAFRKNLADDLKYVEANVRTGYIGSICGVPVIVSKAVQAGNAYLASREAVTCFVKKGVEVEQERDANVRNNKVFARKVMLVALTDATRVIKLTSGSEPEPESFLIVSVGEAQSTLRYADGAMSGSVYVTVTDYNGAAVSGVSIGLSNFSGEEGNWGAGTTDESGKAVIDAQYAGTYYMPGDGYLSFYVYASKEGYDVVDVNYSLPVSEGPEPEELSVTDAVAYYDRESNKLTTIEFNYSGAQFDPELFYLGYLKFNEDDVTIVEGDVDLSGASGSAIFNPYDMVTEDIEIDPVGEYTITLTNRSRSVTVECTPTAEA